MRDRAQFWGRHCLRWYLQKFPLRDGKLYFYNLCHSRLIPQERYAVLELHRGFKMKLDLEDPWQRKIFFFGDYDERNEARLLSRILDPGEVFWDIGANIGYFSLLAARAVQPGGEVVAFEPAKIAFNRLEENVAINSFFHIKLFNLAVTETEGEAILYSSPSDRADLGSNLYGPGQSQTRQEVCQTVALDHFRHQQGLRPPNFLKADVEGAELAVLRGTRKVIATSTPLILIEMKDEPLRRAGTDKTTIQEMLRGYGYVAAYLHRRQWHLTRDVTGVTTRNIFWFKPTKASHREKARRIPVQGNY